MCCAKVKTFEPPMGDCGKSDVAIHSVEPYVIPCEMVDKGMNIEVFSLLQSIDPTGSMEHV